jgi:hypothetical protein
MARSTFDPLRELYIAFIESIRSATVEGHVGGPVSNEPCVQLHRDAVESVILAQRGDHAKALDRIAHILQKITDGESETKSELHAHFPILCCLQAARAAAVCHRELIRRKNAIDSKTLQSDIDDMEKYKTLSTALLNHAILKQPGLADTIRVDPDFRHLR